MEKITIAHISDLHFGSKFWPGSHSAALADNLAQHIADRKPDLILCTGDLVNGPCTVNGYRYARHFFDQIKERYRDIPIKFVPGNHDYAILGMWTIKSLLRRRFDRFVNNNFGPDAILLPHKPFRIKNIAIFGFDSNASALGARGKISQDQINQFAVAANDLSKNCGSFQCVKIAALHHHPMPIPQEGSDYNISMRNAGIVLHQLATHHIDLVLHGHKHFRHSSELQFLEIPEHRIVILGTGSAIQQRSHEKPGNMYNVVSVWSDGSISTESFIAHNTFPQLPHKTTECRTVLHADRDAFSAAASGTGFKVKRLSAQVCITEFGDAKCRFDLAGIKPIRDQRLDSVSFRQQSSFGQFGTVRISSAHLPTYSQSSDNLVTYDDGRTGHEIKEGIFFGRSLGDEDSIDVRLEFRLNAAFALSQQEQKDRGQPIELQPIEWMRVPIDYAMEALAMEVVSDIPGFTFANATVAIFDSDGNRMPRLEQQSEIGTSATEQRITASVKHPRFGFVYELRWSLPDAMRDEDPQFAGDAAEIRRWLSSQDSLEIADLLFPYVDKVEQQYRDNFVSSIVDQGKLEVSIFVFDDRAYRLRVIAGPFAKTAEIWRWEGFKPGVGLAGHSFQRQQLTHYTDHRSRVNNDIYLSTDCAIVRHLGLQKHAALICHPLLYKGKTRIGVLSIGTFDNASSLHAVLDVPQLREKFLPWIEQVSIDTVSELIRLLKAGNNKQNGN